MHAYVINLARSPERRAYITAELNKASVEYEIVTGVDGRDLDLHDTATIDPALFTRRSWPAGVAGCALSHLLVYQKMLTNGLDKALVLEDDVIVPTDLDSLVDAAAVHLEGAEVALLNYDSKETCRMSQEGLVDLPSSRQLVLPIDVCQPRSSAGYVITRDACKRLAESILPVQVGPDDWWFFFRECILDRVRCVVPMPVRKNPKFESTIGLYSLGGTGFKARLVAPLVRHKVPLLHQALSYRRQHIQRKWTRSELVDMPFIEKPSRL